MRLNKRAGIYFLSAVVTACGGSFYYQGDGPGAPINASNIPNMVPRNEPRSKYGNPKSYEVLGKRYYVMNSAENYTESGIASWYGKKFHGRRTSSGEVFDMYAMTAAHKSLPLPTYVQVSNRNNGRQIIVKVNDRGPFIHGRLIDLSYAAAAKLGILGNGTGNVEVRALRAGQSISPSSTTAGLQTNQSKSGALYVQLGAFQQRVNAELLRAQIAGSDIRGAQVSIAKNAEGLAIYRVRIGPLADDQAMRKLVVQLDRAGIRDYKAATD